jgi:hypothetical protein
MVIFLEFSTRAKMLEAYVIYRRQGADVEYDLWTRDLYITLPR